MLTIGKLGSSPDQLAYYEQQVAQGLEDYFSGRGEAPGRWIGGACRGIGVSGQVDRDGFMRAMAGCDPGTGLALRPPRSRTKVAAFDLSFSAPKSVSVLFAVADEVTSKALLAAHERAVEAAFTMSSAKLASLVEATPGLGGCAGTDSSRRPIGIGFLVLGIRSCTRMSWWRT